MVLGGSAFGRTKSSTVPPEVDDTLRHDSSSAPCSSPLPAGASEDAMALPALESADREGQAPRYQLNNYKAGATNRQRQLLRRKVGAQVTKQFMVWPSEHPPLWIVAGHFITWH